MDCSGNQPLPLDRQLIVKHMFVRTGVRLKPAGESIRARDPLQKVEGFTLIELLVGVILLAIGFTASFALFIATVEQMRGAQQRNETQALVEADIALVQQSNDRYTCSTVPCTIAASDRNEDQYVPPPATADFESFRSLCENNTLIDDLITSINGLPNPGGWRQTATAVTGASDPYANGQPNHRYQVRWIANDAAGNQILNRTLVLSPTVAGWCPV